MKITDNEIRRAEKLLLPVDCSFNEERREFLRSMESRDVVACPGSGKTTALLAKLLILSSRMPFPDGRGICVLTHTNVAINQIKQKAGIASQILFRHPNFFGTIQEFANKFLAMPAYTARFGYRHVRMDEDLYNSKARKAFYDHELSWNGAIFGPIAERIKDMSKSEKISEQIKVFTDLEFRFDGDYISYVSGRKTFLNGKKPAKNYSIIHSAKYGILKEGVMRYQDAFPLALWYLHQNPSLSSTFSERFAFVFIDEAQDTNAMQILMLDKAFSDRYRSIVQFLGDPNQAIFNSKVSKEINWVPCIDPIHFSDSLRYGESITNLLRTVRIDDQISLIPNNTRNTLPPCLLTFREGEEIKVLPAFARIIKDTAFDGINSDDTPVFKAIGFVGKDNRLEGKLCISSYFPSYLKQSIRLQRHFSNLLSYFQSRAAEDINEFRNLVLRGISRGLDIADVFHPVSNRAFTASTFPVWLQENNEPAYRELLFLMSMWGLESANHKFDSFAARDDLLLFLNKHWKITKTNTDFEKFARSEEIEQKEPVLETENIFHYGDFKIEVNTVHSVKGETHAATLYLDTFYQKLSSWYLMPFLTGEYPKDKLNRANHIKHLKIAHVAMSRPSHLLCYASPKSSVRLLEIELEKNNWSIYAVDDLIDSDCESVVFSGSESVK